MIIQLNESLFRLFTDDADNIIIFCTAPNFVLSNISHPMLGLCGSKFFTHDSICMPALNINY